MIYNVRTRAGLTQQQLAELAGTKQPVIALLEDADYEGYSLTMLQRIASALNQKLAIHLVPSPEVAPHPPDYSCLSCLGAGTCASA
jgi:transcriptional regulator with XRE-family HTH domain